MGDRLVRSWIADKAARLLVVDVRDAVRELVRRHEVPLAFHPLAGDLVAANVLMGAWIKGSERLSLQLQARDPAVSFMGELSADGWFRARMRANPPARDLVDGVLLAIKYDEDKELYRGMTAMDDDTVERALQRHLVQSDQVQAVVRVHTDVASLRSRALVVERMPPEPGRFSLDDAAWAELQASVAAVDLAAAGDDLGTVDVDDWAVDVLETQRILWQCRCSDASVRRMLLSLGGPTLRELADEDHGAEITCQFCNTVRKVDEAALRSMIRELEAARVAEA